MNALLVKTADFTSDFPTNKEEFLLFRTDKHIKRLSQSAKLLLTDISEEYIFKALEEVIKRNKPKNPIYIRPFVYTSDFPDNS